MNHIVRLNLIAMEALLYLSLSSYLHSPAVLLPNGRATIFLNRNERHQALVNCLSLQIQSLSVFSFYNLKVVSSSDVVSNAVVYFGWNALLLYRLSIAIQ